MCANANVPAASDLMLQARLAAIAELAYEWDGEACPVCWASKWSGFPFCRGCSIALQRAGMMRFVSATGARGHSSVVLRRFDPALFERLMFLYDKCRDYLVQQRRDRRAAGGKEFDAATPGSSSYFRVNN